MRRVILALYAIGFIACSGNHSDPSSTSSDTKTVKKEQPVVNNGKDTVPLTDKEKAQITNEFLVLNVRKIRNGNRDDCDMLTKSLHLLYARQIISDSFPGDIAASRDVNKLISILENNITVQACTLTLCDSTDFRVETNGGQVVIQKRIPVNTMLWAILTDKQRELVLQNVPTKTKNQLLTMESKYATDIRQIKETPTIKAIIHTGTLQKKHL